MAYQALYRVWRSQRFDGIVGQEAITQTLKNAISQHKISHAYLFTGPRGTGKTSAAKIFAKAINCRHSVDGEPCNECETCVAITEGRLSDVIEIDAASNNGVEEIRDIRDKVRYAPTVADYKVYIIDEVHMLSMGAFNALLKTLEEPPDNVVFILATTEPHKVPATIISRTQRYDFKRISVQDIVNHMSDILNDMSIPFDTQALFIIARSAEGGMRDALSILDQVISYNEEEVTVDAAMLVTGSLTYETMDNYIASCVSHDTEEALQQVNRLLSEGKESSQVIEDLELYCRDVLIFQQAPDLLLSQRGEVSDKFEQIASSASAKMIYQFIDILSETEQSLRFSAHPSTHVEVATVKLATVKNNDIDVSASKETSSSTDSSDITDLKQLVKELQTEVEKLKETGISIDTSAGASTTKEQSNQKQRPSTYRIPTGHVHQVLENATKSDLAKMKDIWDDLLDGLLVSQRALLRQSEVVAASPDGMVLAFSYEIVCQRVASDKMLQESVKEMLDKLIQYSPEVVCIPEEKWGDIRQSYVDMTRGSDANSESDGADDIEPVEEIVNVEENSVNEALRLFGEDVVEVIDD